MYPKYGQVVRIVLKPLIRCSLTPLSKIKFTYNHNLPKSVRWLITVILRCLLACSVAIVNKIYHHLSSFLALPRSFILRTLSLVLTIFIMWQRGQYIPKSQNAMWRKFWDKPGLHPKFLDSMRHLVRPCLRKKIMCHVPQLGIWHIFSSSTPPLKRLQWCCSFQNTKSYFQWTDFPVLS